MQTALRVSGLVAPGVGLLALALGAVAGCSVESEPPSSGASEVNSAAPAGITPSAMAAELADAGIDLKALPRLDQLDGPKRNVVMKSFTKALGVNCTFCHDASNPSLDTPNKKVAARMWTDFVGGLALKDGGALYCDSCHTGKAEFLNRSDIPALRRWMTENFVAKVKRTDGAGHACATCHGTPFQGDIFADVWHAE